MPLQFSATSIEVITTLALVVWYIMTPSTKVHMGEGPRYYEDYKLLYLCLH